jgi:hypothetical protein
MPDQADALPRGPGDEPIAADVSGLLAGGRAMSLEMLLDALPQHPPGAVRHMVLLMHRAGILALDTTGFPSRYRLA